MNLINDPKRIPQGYGLRIAAGLIGYFLIMQVIDKHHHVELRLLNLFILVAGVYFALKKMKDTQAHLNYFNALITGVATAAIGSIIFAAFLFVYMQVDSTLMDSIRENEPLGHYLNPYMASFIVALEGVFSGLLVTFVLINYVTTDEVNLPQG
jgi:hypothetical protein